MYRNRTWYSSLLRTYGVTTYHIHHIVHISLRAWNKFMFMFMQRENTWSLIMLHIYNILYLNEVFHKHFIYIYSYIYVRVSINSVVHVWAGTAAIHTNANIYQNKYHAPQRTPERQNELNGRGTLAHIYLLLDSNTTEYPKFRDIQRLGAYK